MTHTKNITVDGVRIEAANLPPELRPLLCYAVEWSFADYHGVHEDITFKPEADIREFVEACKPRVHALEDYCLADHDTPASDEVVVFRAVYHNFLVARTYLWALDCERQSQQLPVYHHD